MSTSRRDFLTASAAAAAGLALPRRADASPFISVVERAELPPRVYLRMTDNWIELSLRFLAPVHGVRMLKDAMTREILPAFEAAKIQIASTTFELVGLPTVKVETQ